MAKKTVFGSACIGLLMAAGIGLTAWGGIEGFKKLGPELKKVIPTDKELLNRLLSDKTTAPLSDNTPTPA